MTPYRQGHTEDRHPLSLADALRQVRDDLATLLEPEPLRLLCRD